MPQQQHRLLRDAFDEVAQQPHHIVVDGSYRLGQLPVEVGNGRATLAGSSTLAGSVLTMDRAARTLVAVGWPLVDAIEAATRTPADTVRATTKGRLQPGADADLVVLDGDLNVVAVVAGGIPAHDPHGLFRRRPVRERTVPAARDHPHHPAAGVSSRHGGHLRVGILLLRLAAALRKRKRRAWRVGLVVSAAATLAHLFRGEQRWGEVLVGLALLVVLVTARSRYTAKV